MRFGSEIGRLFSDIIHPFYSASDMKGRNRANSSERVTRSRAAVRFGLHSETAGRSISPSPSRSQRASSSGNSCKMATTGVRPRPMPLVNFERYWRSQPMRSAKTDGRPQAYWMNRRKRWFIIYASSQNHGAECRSTPTNNLTRACSCPRPRHRRNDCSPKGHQ